MKIAAFLPLSVLLVLAGCVTGSTYVSRTPGPYDGKWKGAFYSDDAPCADHQVSAVGEIKFGKLVGIIKEKSWKVANVKGTVGANGKLDSPLRVSGYSGAKVDLLFKQNTAIGFWESEDCKGTVELTRY